MNELTLDGLRKILLECAGADEELGLDGDILDVEFAELGYDSLALMETASHIQRTYGTALGDDVVVEVRTPRELIALANEAIGAAPH
ncbi:acyl carrier protein [Streptomyces sp. ST2-7A]|uniref:acyl carrier protein n=1 Tax=Streptomyces sp. ST2-7A TaxID=2907214 RepID=UPI001F40CDB8|nr:acyl carrier protein [Streptomyces sp. ST2-7A]MCE7081097.1 acyl carrier protein [Streptomyces sp. ST2-7A]